MESRHEYNQSHHSATATAAFAGSQRKSSSRLLGLASKDLSQRRSIDSKASKLDPASIDGVIENV